MTQEQHPPLLTQCYEFADSHRTYEYQDYLYTDGSGIAHYTEPMQRLEHLLYNNPNAL